MAVQSQFTGVGIIPTFVGASNLSAREIKLTFSEPMDPTNGALSSISSYTLTAPGGGNLPTIIGVDLGGSYASGTGPSEIGLRLNSALTPHTQYQLSVSTAVTDLAGNTLDPASATKTFTASNTAAVGSPTETKPVIDVDVATLPPPPQESGLPKSNINWMGSSYSGVDIKVVVHLYEDFNEILAKLNRDKAEADILQVAYQQLRELLEKVFVEQNADRDNIVKALRSKYPDVSTYMDAYIKQHDITKLHIRSRQDFRAFYEFIMYAPIESINPIRERELLYKQKALDLSRMLKKYHNIPDTYSTVVLGTLQTISVQHHRDKMPIRALGLSYVKGYTRGARTIAGSMIFTVFDEHPLKDLIRSLRGFLRKYGELDYWTKSLLSDQLPPLDITVVFANEYGNVSKLSIYGVEFVNDGATFSIEDIFTEQVLSFVARDVDVMTKLGNIRWTHLEKGMTAYSWFEPAPDMTGDDVYFQSKKSYSKFLNKLRLRGRFKSR